MSKRFPMPIPFGWFCIGYSDELAVGEVRNVYYFNRDMVLFRTEDGSLGLTEPYCPHLGAHLGHGGEVVGNSIRCPFHHWSYDTKGKVTDVPYAKRIPPRAEKATCLKVYPVQEKNQAIWAWYHPKELEPLFDVQEHLQLSDARWSALARHQWEFDSCPQEIAENGVDTAHFKYIHNQENVPQGESSYDGIKRNSNVFVTRTEIDESGREYQRDYVTAVTQYGSGQKWVDYRGDIDYLLIVLVTPVTDEKVELRFAISHRIYAENSQQERLCREAIGRHLVHGGVVTDIPIWHKKIHLREPLLCDGDGPIMQFRKYYAQFYVGGPYGADKSDGETEARISLVS
jgi:3-ketosteroid 9alpha-monooxygenase subunit A